MLLELDIPEEIFDEFIYPDPNCESRVAIVKSEILNNYNVRIKSHFLEEEGGTAESDLLRAIEIWETRGNKEKIEELRSSLAFLRKYGFLDKED